MYSPLVRKGGIVAFHDIVAHDLKDGCEVDKFWNEVKVGYRNVEIVERQNQKCARIGVLYLFLVLINFIPDRKRKLCDIYSNVLGFR